jgi:hypothetical protein
MAKLTVKWSKEAEDQKNTILTFWFRRNKSPRFPIKLESEIYSELKFIAINPSIKKKLSQNNYYLRIREYWIIYHIESDTLYVQAFLDARQDPNNLAKQLR